MATKYLVKSDGLYGPVTMGKPECYKNNESDEDCPDCNAFHLYLASLPKICRCEGLKDGAIVEEKKDWQKYECDNCDGCGWYEGGKALKTTCEKCGGSGYVAIPLHREQGEETGVEMIAAERKRQIEVEGWNNQVYSRPECPFQYCDSPNKECEKMNKCHHR